MRKAVLAIFVLLGLGVVGCTMPPAPQSLAVVEHIGEVYKWPPKLGKQVAIFATDLETGESIVLTDWPSEDVPQPRDIVRCRAYNWCGAETYNGGMQRAYFGRVVDHLKDSQEL